VAATLPRAQQAFRDGDFAQAERLLKRVLLTEPRSTGANELMAYILGNRGDVEGAHRLLEIATSAPEASRESWYYLGKYFQQRGDHAPAVAAFSRAIALDANFFEALHDLGASQAEQGEAEAALASFDRALAVQPRSLEALYNRGRALDALWRFEAAVESYDRALAVNPGHVESWTNRGGALLDLARYEEALESFDRAIALSPSHVEAWSGRGVTLHALRRHAEAMAAYDEALRIRPGDREVLARQFYAHARLGEFEKAWPLFEHRWVEIGPLRHSQIPEWRGRESIKGKRVLTWCEQGFGDTLQYCRYVERLEREGAEVVLEVQEPLRRLLAHSFPGRSVVSSGMALPPCDLQVPLMSLPLAFDSRLETIPMRVPYLSVDAESVDLWRARIAPAKRGFNVGIACSGNPRQRQNALRGIALEKFSGLAAYADLFLIQKDIPSADADWLRANDASVRTFPDTLGDFNDSAALVECMDLVICTDTSLAHLAGALGKPAWLLLSWESDWRWLLDRDDSPWYPTLRLFRRDRFESADALMTRVRAALADRRR
jgi:tetratricopeptide (TPR) repeat protein